MHHIVSHLIESYRQPRVFPLSIRVVFAYSVNQYRLTILKLHVTSPSPQFTLPIRSSDTDYNLAPLTDMIWYTDRMYFHALMFHCDTVFCIAATSHRMACESFWKCAGVQTAFIYGKVYLEWMGPDYLSPFYRR